MVGGDLVPAGAQLVVAVLRDRDRAEPEQLGARIAGLIDVQDHRTPPYPCGRDAVIGRVARA